MRRFAQLADALFGRLSICAKAGVLAGLVAGFLFGLYQVGSGFISLPAPALILAIAAIGLLASLSILVVAGIWLRYGLAAVSGPALVNGFATTLLTVVIANAVNWAPATVWIGLVCGLAVGFSLCRLCAAARPASEEAGHGD